jgi:hypothetical protein
MLLQFWSSLPTVEVPCRLPEVGARTDVGELKRTFLRSVTSLLGFDAALEDLAASFESRYALADKIRSQGSAACYSVNDYLKSNSQLEYIEECRIRFGAETASGEGTGKTTPVLRPVFIHVSKNAGNSIAAAAGVRIVNAGHRTAASWVRENGGGSPMFAVVRNPFDRVVSEYSFRRRRYERGETNPHLANLDKSFEEWTIATFRDGEFRTRAFFEDRGIAFNQRNMVDGCLLWFVPQVRWLGDDRGKLLPMEILRFEDLESDWAAFARMYGIPTALPRRNPSARAPDYREYYSDMTRALVGEYYREDLEAFGYEF